MGNSAALLIDEARGYLVRLGSNSRTNTLSIYSRSALCTGIHVSIITRDPACTVVQCGRGHFSGTNWREIFGGRLFVKVLSIECCHFYFR
jgi:hypothetical protein